MMIVLLSSESVHLGATTGTRRITGSRTQPGKGHHTYNWILRHIDVKNLVLDPGNREWLL
jgi:hypothetical protein